MEPLVLRPDAARHSYQLGHSVSERVQARGIGRGEQHVQALRERVELLPGLQRIRCAAWRTNIRESVII
jgi:hypothetical protein